MKICLCIFSWLFIFSMVIFFGHNSHWTPNFWWTLWIWSFIWRLVIFLGQKLHWSLIFWWTSRMWSLRWFFEISFPHSPHSTLVCWWRRGLSLSLNFLAHLHTVLLPTPYFLAANIQLLTLTPHSTILRLSSSGMAVVAALTLNFLAHLDTVSWPTPYCVVKKLKPTPSDTDRHTN